jgi:nucleoside-diphosphate-sugar epimerase
MRILITGANGFVGRALVPACLAAGHQVIAATRNGETDFTPHSHLEDFRTGDLSRSPYWYDVLRGVDVIIHLAARVHQRVGSSDLNRESGLRINYYATRALARAAIETGVKRFIFISTVQALADVTGLEKLTEKMKAHPVDPYGLTKLAAEQSLENLFESSDRELAILRPTLVYGPGVRANFSALMRAVQFGLPLPLKSVQNSRSVLYIGNLVDAIVTTAQTSKNASGAYLLKDGQDLSTCDMIEAIGKALGKQPRLIAFPTTLLRVLAGLAGQPGLARRLLESLAVDDRAFRDHFQWTPPFSQDDGMKATADWLLNR